MAKSEMNVSDVWTPEQITEMVNKGYNYVIWIEDRGVMLEPLMAKTLAAIGSLMREQYPHGRIVQSAPLTGKTTRLLQRAIVEINDQCR